MERHETWKLIAIVPQCLPQTFSSMVPLWQSSQQHDLMVLMVTLVVEWRMWCHSSQEACGLYLFCKGNRASTHPVPLTPTHSLPVWDKDPWGQRPVVVVSEKAVDTPLTGHEAGESHSPCASSDIAPSSMSPFYIPGCLESVKKAFLPEWNRVAKPWLAAGLAGCGPETVGHAPS